MYGMMTVLIRSMNTDADTTRERVNGVQELMHGIAACTYTQTHACIHTSYMTIDKRKEERRKMSHDAWGRVRKREEGR